MHPAVLEHWQQDELAATLADIRRRYRRTPAGLDRAEFLTLRWLEAVAG